jgi:hypothetical protein
MNIFHFSPVLFLAVATSVIENFHRVCLVSPWERLLLFTNTFFDAITVIYSRFFLVPVKFFSSNVIAAFPFLQFSFLEIHSITGYLLVAPYLYC